MSPNGAVVAYDDETTSVGEAIERVLGAASAMLEDRVELGRLELQERSSRIGGSLVLFGVGVFFAACAWVALLVAAARGLAQWLPLEAGIAAIGGVNFLLAGILLWAGRRRLARLPAATE